MVNLFNCLCFTITADCRTHLPLKVKLGEAWGLRGEDGLLPLGCSQSSHPPRDVFSSPVMVAATSGWAGTCKFLRSQSSQHKPKRCQFYKEHGRVVLGRPPTLEGSASYPHTKGTGRAGACCSASVPSLHPPESPALSPLRPAFPPFLPPPPLPLPLMPTPPVCIDVRRFTICSGRIGST